MQFAQTNKKSGHLLIDWYLEEGGGLLPRKRKKVATDIAVVTKTSQKCST